MTFTNRIHRPLGSPPTKAEYDALDLTRPFTDPPTGTYRHPGVYSTDTQDTPHNAIKDDTA